MMKHITNSTCNDSGSQEHKGLGNVGLGDVIHLGYKGPKGFEVDPGNFNESLNSYI
jgi:hypothetical protein